MNFIKGNGIRLYTEQGEEYVDAVSGTFNLSLGYDHPELVHALKKQLDAFVHVSSSFTSGIVKTTLDALIKYAPSHISNGWLRDITGSTANEGAVKIANKYNGKTEVISLYLAHHGQTLYTTTISGNAFRKAGFPNTLNSQKMSVPAPYCYRCPLKQKYPGCGFACIETIHDQINYASSHNVSALIMEPILGNGGNIVPPDGYFIQLRKLCDEYKIVLIADEVQTGIGRTGYMFASDYFNMMPDIITLAKGLGGIGIPAAAILYRKELEVLESHEHSFTSGGNMLSLVASQKTLEIIGKPAFLETIRTNGKLLGKLLNALKEKYSFIGDVRGMGYMWGLEIVDRNNNPDIELTNFLIAEALDKYKLILRGSRYKLGNVIKVRPSLIASQEDLQKICESLDLLFKTIKPL